MTADRQAWERYADLPGIDLAKGMETWRDFALLRQFLQQFPIDHACSTNQLSALLDAGESEAASALIHKLKGAAATLSLTAAFEAAAAIEDCTDAPAARSLLPQLRAALDGSFASIAQLPPATATLAARSCDRAAAAPLLARLLQAFGAQSHSQAGLLLMEVSAFLPVGALGAIQDCLDGANLRAAAVLVHELARENAIAIP